MLILCVCVKRARSVMSKALNFRRALTIPIDSASVRTHADNIYLFHFDKNANCFRQSVSING